MRYNSKNIAIIIPTNSIGNTLNKELKSITTQTVKPGQVLIISTKKKIFNLKKNFIYIYSKKKNQVYQRKLAKDYIKKNIKLILQLDDYVMLKKNALEELINEWNLSNKNVKGIGLIPSNYNPPKPNFLQILIDKNISKPGKVLKSGYVTAWGKNFFNNNTEWLNGGSTSWKYNKDIFSRKYPLSKWCVAEDLIYSYKKRKNSGLKLSKSSKCKYLKRSNTIGINDSFKRGYFFSKIIKNFVSYNNNLSLIYFYNSTIIFSIGALLKNLIKLDLNKTSYNFGRFIGCWARTYKYKIE